MKAMLFVKDSLDLNLDEDTGIFTTADDDVLHRVEADKHGKAVVFFHDLMHDGEPLKENSPTVTSYSADDMSITTFFM